MLLPLSFFGLLCYCIKKGGYTMKYTDLIFDLYGTLVDIHTEENVKTWERTAIYYGFYGAKYTGEELHAAFLVEMTKRETAAGQNYECFPDLPCEVTFAQLFRDKGVTKNAQSLGFQAAQMFRMLSLDYIRLYPGVLDALKSLRSAGCRLWLLSNAQRVFTAYELRHLELHNQFNGIYISSDYGCRKPDPRFFRALVAEQNLDISKTLMIGNDRRTDIAGAQAIGLDTLYLHANITPPDQSASDPGLHPALAPKDAHNYEFEGNDWNEICKLLLNL